MTINTCLRRTRGEAPFEDSVAPANLCSMTASVCGPSLCVEADVKAQTSS